MQPDRVGGVAPDIEADAGRRAMLAPLFPERTQVVILGGGFGGLNAAKALRHADVEVTVVDRRNHHVFQPLLYQVATAGLSPGAVVFDFSLEGRANTGTPDAIARDQAARPPGTGVPRRPLPAGRLARECPQDTDPRQA